MTYFKRRYRGVLLGAAKLKYDAPTLDNCVAKPPRDLHAAGLIKENSEKCRDCRSSVYRIIIGYEQKAYSAQIVTDKELTFTTMRYFHELRQGLKDGTIEKGTELSFECYYPPSECKGNILPIMNVIAVPSENNRTSAASFVSDIFRPAHPGAFSFSSKSIHDCTVPVEARLRRPLPSAVLLMFKEFREQFGSAAIVGSAVLAEFVKSISGCRICYADHYGERIKNIITKNQSVDIDVIVPFDHKKMNRFLAGGPRPQADQSLHRSLNEYVDFINHYIENHKNDHPQTRIEFHGREHELDSYDMQRYSPTDSVRSSMSGYPGMAAKVDFDIFVDNKARHVQIIVVRGYPGIPKQTFEEFAISTFDVNIVKCYVDLTKRITTPPAIVFPDRSTIADIYNGHFRMEIQEWNTPQQVHYRIRKYLRRGFYLKSLTFHHRMREILQEEILEFLRHQQKRLDPWFMAGFHVPDDIVNYVILPYVGEYALCPPHRRRIDNERTSVRREIIRSLM
jgi:hypothetical protein